jgi:peptidoglycan/LPS O-acetylase OafA/YrhL
MKSAPASRIPSLDGLRAISILLVIGGHLWWRVPGASGVPVVFAGLGVHVFFVLSGYLITRLLQEEQERAGQISLVAFYRRRCFRIFPAAFTYILIIALLSPSSRSALLYAATYTVSYHVDAMPVLFAHLWSLSVEEQFYLLWPLALLLGFRRRAGVAWSAMFLAAAFRLALALSPSHFSAAYLHYSFPGTMDSIAAGCLLAIYWPQVRKRCAWMAESPAIPIAVAVTAWTLDVALWGDTSSTAVRSLSMLWGAVPLLIALLVFLLIERRDWIFNNPVASAIGVLSYSLYLWQQAFTLENQHSALASLLMLAGCAVASYLLIEKPMLKLGASIKSRKPIREHLERATLSPVFQTEALTKK